MGFSIQCDTDVPKEVASLGGMRELRQWTDTLPHEGSEEIAHLFAHGWSQEAAVLLDQLRDSLALRPPLHDVEHTVEAMIQAIRPEAEVVSLTDGLGRSRDE